MLVPTTPRTIKYLLQHRSSAGTRHLLGEFWARFPPNYTAIEEGKAFLRFISSLRLDIAELAEAISYDEESLRRPAGS